MRVLDLMPEGFEERFPEGSLTPKGERLLELQIPDDFSPETTRRIAEITMKALPRFTTAARTIRKSRAAAGAREAAIEQDFAPGSATVAQRRRETFNRGPAYARAGLQAATAMGAFSVVPGTQTRGDEVPPAEGFAERAGRLVGSVAGFTAAAAPVGRAARMAGASVRAAGMIGAGAAAAIPEGTLRERAIRAGITGATAGVSHEIGRRVANRFATPAAKAATHAVTGASAFGVIQPQVESRALGHPPPTADETLTAGAELLALNLLLGGRAFIPGGRAARSGQQKRGPEASAAHEEGPSIATPEQRAEWRQPAPKVEGEPGWLRERPMIPGGPMPEKPLLALPPGNRPGPPDATVTAAYNEIQDGPPAPVLGGRTPRQAFLQLVQERAATAEDIPAAVEWARRNVERAVEIQRHIEPPPVPPGADALARRSPGLTADLQRTLGDMAGDFSVEVPGVGRVQQAGFVPALTRVYPWDPNPVRVVIADRATGQVYPATFRTVDEMAAAIQRPQPPPVTPEALARVSALERNVAAGGPKAEAQGRRLARVREETGIAAGERREAALSETERSLAALERQIAERPNDARVRAWRRRAAALRAQVMGRVPASEPVTAIEPKKEVPGPRTKDSRREGRNVPAGEPVPVVPQAPKEEPPARSLTPAVATPGATRTESAAAPPNMKPANAVPTQAPPDSRGERVIAPDFVFREQSEAEHMRNVLGKGIPGSEPVVVKTRKGYQIEVNSAPAQSRTKKIPAPVRPTTPPASPPAEKPAQRAIGRTEPARLAPEDVDRTARRKLSLLTPGQGERIDLEVFAAEMKRLHPEDRTAVNRRAMEMERARTPKDRAIGRLPAPSPVPAPAATETPRAPASEVSSPAEAPRDHPPLRDVAIAEVLAEAPNKSEFARMQREGATDEQIIEALRDAYGQGGGSTSGKLEYTYGAGREGSSLFRFKDESGKVQTLGLSETAAAVREGMGIRTPQAEMEARGQSDMFGGQTFLGGSGAEPRAAAPSEPARTVPTGEGGSTEAPAGRSTPITVRYESVHRHPRFQKRETNNADLVDTKIVQRHLEVGGGFNRDRLVEAPPIVWRDAKGELGPAGRLYTLNHHRLEIAQHGWERQPHESRPDEPWVKTGRADREGPAIEFHGTLEQAEARARDTNFDMVSHSYTEKAGIVAELRAEGKDWKAVAAKLDTKSVGKAKAMFAFSKLDPGVREEFYPSGKEESLMGGVAHGETLGAWVAKNPRFFPPDAQRDWLLQAKGTEKDGKKSGGLTPTELDDQIRGWHEVMVAAKQEGLPGLETGEMVLVMTPKQFSDALGPIQRRVSEVRYVAKYDKAAMSRGASRAESKGDIARAKTMREEVEQLEIEKQRLTELWGRVKPRMLRALSLEAQGKARLEDEIKSIREEVDAGLGSIPSKPFAAVPGLGSFPGNVGQWLYEMLRGPRDEKGPVEERASLAMPMPGSAPPEISRMIVDAVKAGEPVRAEQERGYTQERGRRIARATEAAAQEYGVAARRARFREQAGPLERRDFQPLRFNERQLDQLSDAIEKSRRIGEFEKNHAYEGLDNLLAGRVPTENELRLLAQVFGEEVATAALRKLPVPKAVLLAKLANLSKALKASMDISAPARQGWALTSRPEWRRAWRAQMEALESEQGFRENQERIYNTEVWIHGKRVNLYLMSRQGKLSITEPGEFITNREEPFISDLAERLHEPFVKHDIPGKAIPLAISRGVRASNRAYTGFLNDLRFGVFKSMIRDAVKAGRDPITDQNLVRDICRFINDATGRGELGALQKDVQLLNTAFWSPRFIASRLHLMNPVRYKNMDPFVRRQAIRTVLASASIYATITGLAALATGTAIATATRDPEFGKVKIGNTRFDLGGGFLQYIRFGSRFLYALRHQGEPGYKGNTAWDESSNFFWTKVSPAAAFVQQWASGKNEDGQPFDLTRETIDSFTPMAIEDATEAAEEWRWEHPEMTAAAVGASAVGIGVQTYRPRPKRRRRKMAVAQ